MNTIDMLCGLLETYGNPRLETRAELWARWSKEVDARIAALQPGEKLTPLFMGMSPESLASCGAAARKRLAWRAE